jgi:hypothetical protein
VIGDVMCLRASVRSAVFEGRKALSSVHPGAHYSIMTKGKSRMRTRAAAMCLALLTACGSGPTNPVDQR